MSKLIYTLKKMFAGDINNNAGKLDEGSERLTTRVSQCVAMAYMKQ